MIGCRSALVAALATGVACAAPPAGPGFVVQELPTNAVFTDVVFLDPENGFLVGGGYGIAGGLVGRTSDGGRTWSFRSGLVETGRPSDALDLRAGWFFDTQTGLVVGDGLILRTVDGGERWRRVHRGPARVGHLCDVFFVDDTHGWAGGHGGLLATVDGGEEWFTPRTEEDVPVGETEGVPGGNVGALALHFFDRQEGIAVGRSGRVLETRDGGVAWWPVAVPVPPGGPDLASVHFRGARLGWIVGERGTILRTVDGGATWRRAASGTHDDLTDVHFVSEADGWAVGYRRSDGTSVVLESHDGGASWSQHLRVAGEELRALTFTDPAHGWAVGDRVRRDPQKLLVYR